MKRAQRRAEPFTKDTLDRSSVNDPTASPATQYLAFRLEGDRHCALFEAEQPQRIHGVRGHLHPGADFGERARLLVNRHLDAAPMECQCCGKPGDAAAD